MEIGDKVLCINDSVSAESFYGVCKMYPKWVQKGKEYTIRDIFHNDGIVTGIVLNEIHNIPVYIPVINKIQEPAFGIFRFTKSIGVNTKIEEEEFSTETNPNLIQV